MPAGNLIPNYDRFAEVVYRAGVYGPREHARDVVQAALNNLGVAGRKALEAGIKKSRLVPDENGNLRQTAIFAKWFGGLADVRVRDRIAARIARIEIGNFGDSKSIGGGVPTGELQAGDVAVGDGDFLVL